MVQTNLDRCTYSGMTHVHIHRIVVVTTVLLTASRLDKKEGNASIQHFLPVNSLRSLILYQTIPGFCDPKNEGF